jgi:hypothetical protein
LPLIGDEFQIGHARASSIFIYGFFPDGLIAISKMFEQNVRGIATGFILGCGVIIGCGLTPFFLGLAGDLLSFELGIATILSSRFVFLLREICPPL